MRPRFQWATGKRTFDLGERTLIMGVVNVTPDSFSDGGKFAGLESAVEHALRLLAEGADILDIGGESTRPGASVGADPSVPAEEEILRVVPVIKGILKRRPDAAISIDTYKSITARAAIAAGAEIVNDVSGMAWDSEMAKTVAECRCGVVLMHTRGTPNEWHNLPKLNDPVNTVISELQERIRSTVSAGTERSHVVVDPGLGFGKRFEENYPLISHLHEFAKLGFPLLVGPSRKSFIGRTVGRRLGELSGEEVKDLPPDQRLHGTIAAVTSCVLQGAHIIRVHDVRPTVEAAAVADAILASN